jgi:hypothetical protein
MVTNPMYQVLPLNTAAISLLTLPCDANDPTLTTFHLPNDAGMLPASIKVPVKPYFNEY